MEWSKTGPRQLYLFPDAVTMCAWTFAAYVFKSLFRYVCRLTPARSNFAYLSYITKQFDLDLSSGFPTKRD